MQMASKQFMQIFFQPSSSLRGKNLRKDKHDQKEPSETWPRLEEFDDIEIYWPLEDQTPLYLR